MSEISALKVSCSTDMSPTAIFLLAVAPVRQLYGDQQHVGAGGVPGVVRDGWSGWVYRVGTGGGYTGTPPDQSQDTIFNIF